MLAKLAPSQQPVGYSAVITSGLDLVAYLAHWKPELQLLVGAFSTALLAAVVHQAVTPNVNVPPNVPPSS